MSLVRRVKSFSIKKYKSTDELKDSGNQKATTPKVRKRGLIREKSLSMDEVPIRLDLERNTLFIRQRSKVNSSAEFIVGRGKREEREARQTVAVPVPAPRRANLKKRKSVSFDDVRFSKCIEEFSENPVQLRRINESRSGRLSRYKTVDVVKDLIQEFNSGPNGGVDNSSKPGNFPVCDEEEVQVRQTKSTARIARPQTYASSLTDNIPKKENSLIFRGVHCLEIGKDVSIEIHNRETLRLQNGYLQVLDEKGNTKITIRKDLKLRKGAKWTGKKEVEMRDITEKIYKLHFDSIEDAKFFIEIERSFSAVVSSSPFVGPWSQLKRLLKKRSSRDLLESKGILKNEPIFGNTLKELCDEQNRVPVIVTRIAEMIEEKQNITCLGVYRASANLAIVQNIRCQIDYGKWDILEKYRNEVDVLAGTLKLFFRELKEPLISHEVFQELNQAVKNEETRNDIPKILEKLPQPNRDTLHYIIRHLLKVCEYKEQNRMDFHNISIVWGPSLLTLPDNCTDLVAQTTEFTRIVEELLIFYSNQKFDVPEKPKRIDFGCEVIKRLIETIEKHIETEGIYRKSGSTSKMEAIVKLIEKQNLDLLDFSKYNIHDLCCVLKRYVMSSRESIVPDEFFQWYCTICDNLNDTEIRDEVVRKITELPRKEIIYLLFDHLRKVVSHDQKNKMTYHVLSDIWMTTLMANVSAKTYKTKVPKYSKLFLILLNLGDNNVYDLPDVVLANRGRTKSKYDNVPDDIEDDAETSDDKIYTKL